MFEINKQNKIKIKSNRNAKEKWWKYQKHRELKARPLGGPDVGPRFVMAVPLWFEHFSEEHFSIAFGLTSFLCLQCLAISGVFALVRRRGKQHWFFHICNNSQRQAFTAAQQKVNWAEGFSVNRGLNMLRAVCLTKCKSPCYEHILSCQTMFRQEFLQCST